MALTREQILTQQDRKLERVAVPEWGGEVYVRSLDGLEREDFEQLMTSVHNKELAASIRAVTVVACTCDAQGRQLFTLEDVKPLSTKNWRPLDRIYEAAVQLNKLFDASVDGLAKNSSTGQGADLPTASPLPSDELM